MIGLLIRNRLTYSNDYMKVYVVTSYVLLGDLIQSPARHRSAPHNGGGVQRGLLPGGKSSRSRNHPRPNRKEKHIRTYPIHGEPRRSS